MEQSKEEYKKALREELNKLRLSGPSAIRNSVGMVLLSIATPLVSVFIIAYVVIKDVNEKIDSWLSLLILTILNLILIYTVTKVIRMVRARNKYILKLEELINRED